MLIAAIYYILGNLLRNCGGRVSAVLALNKGVLVEANFTGKLL